MSKIRSEHVFTSESVSEGHPDKVCDIVSDSILDACLTQDSESRVACETMATTDFLAICGEITTRATVDWESVARAAVAGIGYDKPGLGFSASDAKVIMHIHKQSPDIAMGVDAAEQGAGDQGMMFGYASNETPELMPAPILYAHRIVGAFAELRRNDPEAARYLRPDAKGQVSVRYRDGRPVAVETIVLSHQHSPEIPAGWLEEQVREVVAKTIPAELMEKQPRYFVNPTGRFEIGGPAGDTGLTGRKIIVDTYGGVGSHGGGAFSGKDPSKVDRSAAYFCRYVARNLVGAGLAAKCEIQVSYAIGVAEPLSVNVDTYGTGILADDRDYEKIVRAVFDMRPAAMIETLGLKHPGPWRYRDTAAYGHFGRQGFPWERQDRTEEILKAAAPFRRR
ncbi:MAG: methionine adenosyltransferase [Victivallaceae bacterium]|nr:methionine adenosyltransferase [Victivallaceae bacterium]